MKSIVALINESPILSKLFKEVEPFYQHDDPGHNLSHVLRVATNAVQLCTSGVSMEECIASALLHDIVNLPKNSPDRKRASYLCAVKAQEILENLDWPSEKIGNIFLAIEDHSFSRGQTPRNELGRILQDADRLEALGAIGIMRVFSTGALMKAEYFHATDPWAKNRPLEDTKYSIDHFFTKLLKLKDSFQTETGRRLAQERTAFLQVFLDQLKIEIQQ